jgi:hypothetical protein
LVNSSPVHSVGCLAPASGVTPAAGSLVNRSTEVRVERRGFG